MAKVLFITPQQGVQQFDSDHVSATLDAMQNGSPLSAEQQKLASFLSPQSNVNAGVDKSATSFLSGLKQTAAPNSTSVSAQQPKTNISNPGSFDISKLLFPGVSQNPFYNQGTSGIPLGDATLSSEVENLRLENERFRLQQERKEQLAKEALNKAFINNQVTYSAGPLAGANFIDVAKQIPGYINNLRDINSNLKSLRPPDTSLRDSIRKDLLGSRASIIGTAPSRSIIGQR